jgi:hypothetical protein
MPFPVRDQPNTRVHTHSIVIRYPNVSLADISLSPLFFRETQIFKNYL